MYRRTHAGQVSVNVDGERYTAAYRVIAGAMVVTCGAVSKTIEVGYADDIKSVARTVLKAIVSEELHGDGKREAASQRGDDFAWSATFASGPWHRSRTRH